MATQNYFPTPATPASQSSSMGTPASSGVLGGGAGSSAGGPKKGSGFVNLDRYLGANRGNTNALADTVSGSLQDKVGAANQGLDNAVNSESSRIQSGAGMGGNAKYDYSQKYFDTQGRSLSDQQWQDAMNTDGDTAAGYEQNSQNVMRDRMNELNRANPFSPAAISGGTESALMNAQSQYDRLDGLGKDLKNDSSMQQQALTSKLNTKGNYNRGFSMLDSFLMNADQQANERAGGVNRLNAGVDSALAGRKDVGAARTSLQNQAADVANKRWQDLKNTAQGAMSAPRIQYQAPAQPASPAPEPQAAPPAPEPMFDSSYSYIPVTDSGPSTLGTSWADIMKSMYRR